MATDAQTLLSQAKCYICLGITLGEALQLALLAQIADGITTTGSSQLVAYTVAPPAPPPDQTKNAIAYDPTGVLPTLGWNTNTLAYN